MTWVVAHANSIPSLWAGEITRLQWAGASSGGMVFARPPDRKSVEWLFAAGAGNRTSTQVVGFEISFSPMMSVQAAAFAGGPECLDAVVAAHRAAIDRALVMWERHATVVRLDVGTGVEWCPAVGLVALADSDISSERRTVHTRVYVPAKAPALHDALWRPLVPERFLDWQQYGWDEYHHALAGGLNSTLGWEFEHRDSTRTPWGNPALELAGTPEPRIGARIRPALRALADGPTAGSVAPVH
ncbi:relaxase domain-containing protein [Rhodococcus sp. NPDC059234]|uniref:relaxase domain-containing protein n=1 Tax=Rhodococcus sp. NPDC059234 TaxID=3346781 RepID=UPI00366B4DF5